MTPQASEKDDWELEAIQKRYRATHGLNLTIDQAERVYRYERLRDTPSDKHYFSVWEEFDFEFAIFQNILAPEQVEAYKAKHREQIDFNEQQLVQGDREYAKQVEAAEDLLRYYEIQLLPDLKGQRMIIYPAFFHEREKVDYLKAEYKKYLNDRKKFILVEHFRHSKTLQPLRLQLSLLHHKRICLLPDYNLFRASMDVPTSVIADYLERKLKRRTAAIMELLKDPLQALEEFRKANTAKHSGELKRPRGWHTTAVNEEDNLMFILLLDSGEYGC